MNIRDAHKDDAAALAEIHIKGWQAAYGGMVDQAYLDSLSIDERTADWQKWMDEGTQPRIIMGDNNSPLGFCAFGKLRTAPPGSSPIRPLYTSEIYAIYLLPEYWRKGIGTALMRDAAENLKSQGHESLCLWALEKNKQAGSFYKKLGGERCGKMEIEIGPSPVREVCYGWRKLGKILA